MGNKITQSFILGGLIALVGRIEAAAEKSRLLGGFSREEKSDSAIARKWRESKISGLLNREENTAAYDSSVLYGALDGACDGVMGAASRTFERAAGEPEDSFFVRLYKKTLGRLGFFDYDFILGAFFTVMFCFPGQIWSNIYALAGVFAVWVLLFFVTAAKKREVFHLSKMGLPFLLFMGAAFFAIWTSTDKSDSIRVFLFFATSFLISMLIAASVTDAVKLKRFLSFIFIAVFVTALIGLLQRVAGVEINASLTDIYANQGMPGRIFATFENPNNYAEFLVMMLPFCVVYCIDAKTAAARVIFALMTAVPFGALLMTYSRSSWIGIAAAAVIFVFLYNRRLFPLFILACLVALPVADVAMGGTISDRVMTLFTVRANNTRDSSMMYRVYIWKGASDMLSEYWHTGIGLGPSAFKSVYLFHSAEKAMNAVHSHMLYLEVWLEMGLIGIASYGAYILTMLKNAYLSAKKATSPIVRGTLIAGFSALVGISLTAAVEYVWYYPRVMFAFFTLTGIITAVINIAKSEAAVNLK